MNKKIISGLTAFISCVSFLSVRVVNAADLSGSKSLMPKTTKQMEETTVTEISAGTEETTVTEISAGTEETTVTGISAGTEETTVTGISAGTEETTVTEISAGTEETTAAEMTADTEETAVTDITDIFEETNVTDITESEVTADTTAETSYTADEGMMYGDIDENGVVELTDLTFLSLYLLGDYKLSEYQLLLADVEYDEIVDIADLARLKQYICKDPNVLKLGKEDEETKSDLYESGIDNGYDYIVWNQYDKGNVSMSHETESSYSCKWSEVENCVFELGKKLGSRFTYDHFGRMSVEYDVSYFTDGVSFFGVYGWTEDPTIEYYIIEGWGSWRPPGMNQSAGTVTSDGRAYDIYKCTRINQPTIHGTETYDQVWSVAKNNPVKYDKNKNSKYPYYADIKGTITLGNHFKAWKTAGIETGNIYEICLEAEAFRSNGNLKINNFFISIM